MEMKEIWKPIPGYEKYLVSNMGRVMSNNTYSHAKPKLMSIINHGNGYLYVTLNKGNTSKNFYVHRLVAMAFLDNPDGLEQVDHKDHDRANNAVSNLEWVTAKENLHRSVHLLKRPRAGGYGVTKTRYISYRPEKNKYRLCNKRLKVDKLFSTLQEAIDERNRLLRLEA